MPDLFEAYEKKHLQHVARVNRQLKDIYSRAAGKISLKIPALRFKEGLFELKKYPQLKKAVEKIIGEMQRQIYVVILNGIEKSWDISNEKNDALVDKRFAGNKLPKDVAKILYDPNREALRNFIERKEKGLNLSERVWNTLSPFKNELEQTIGLGIAEGKPAKTLAKDIKKYLNEPDRLFRRVRSEEGVLKLSASAREYNPGQGVYRSSYKNALRVTRTETNIAYRTADHERWKTMPFVTGIEVRLSNAHPRYDICDPLAGNYPKDFKFTGWHPQCLCSAVPILMDDEQYDKVEDQLLAGKSISVPKKWLTNNPPESFKKYMVDNKKRIAGWKNKPYWVSDNKKYI